MKSGYSHAAVCLLGVDPHAPQLGVKGRWDLTRVH